MKTPFMPSRAVAYSYKARPRHRGQALILAVTIMLLAALISAGFLLVVSGNLNQTARVVDKTRALEAARTGLAFVNDRLTNSFAGENWRPSLVSPPPAASDRIYYSDVDRAHGWAGVFSRFPNPYAPASDAPQFLARVDRVVPGDPDAANFIGALRITVIGLSPDDPSAYTKVVAYKGGSAAPLGRAMRAIANFDWASKTVPEGKVTTYNAGTGEMEITGKGLFPDAPFNLMIGNAKAGAPLRNAVVEKVSQTIVGNQVTTNVKLTDYTSALFTGANEPQVNERVQIAAALGAPTVAPTPPATPIFSGIDFDNDKTLDSTEQVLQPVSTDTTVPGSITANGSLALFGDTVCSALDSRTRTAIPGYEPGAIRVKGLIAQTAYNTGASISGVADGGNVTGNLVASSNDPNFPLGTPITPDQDSVLKDDFNGINKYKNRLRQTSAFTPPDITSPAALSRYRQMAQDNNGKGIYINNREDLEKIWDGTKFREMTQAELVNMWLSPTAATPLPYQRLGTPKAVSATDASLEEQHLRGWIGPDEFRARGALVELYPEGTPGNGPTPKIVVTLDARGDGTTLNQGPVGTASPDPSDQRAWHDANGALLPGIYQKEFEWPVNGVIFAEGNVRVRGISPNNIDPKNSLTIVSLGNIYIDGSLNAGQRKVALLARKNVIANPTALVSRVEGWTRTTAAATNTSTIAVEQGTAFQPGDWVNVSGNANYAGQVLTVSPTTITLGTPVTVTLGAAISAATAPDMGDYSRVLTYANVFQRHIPNLGQTSVRLAFRHSALQRAGLEWDSTDTAAPASAQAYSKKAADEYQTIVTGAEKSFLVQQDDPTPDTFALTTPTPAPTTFDLTTFIATVSSTTPNGTPTPTWAYSPTIQNTYDNIKPFYLAAIGSRKAMVGTPAGGYPWYQQWRPTPDPVTGKQTMVATSLVPSFGTSTVVAGALAPSTFNISNDRWGTDAQNFKYLGFNPVDVSTTPGDDVEDLTTVDSSFYTKDDDHAFALDSKLITLDAVPGQAQSTFALQLTRDTTGAPLTGFAAPNEADLTTPPNILPYYRVNALKLENITFNATHEFTGLNPALAMDIHAFTYAQEGSWFVIPAPFDANAQNGQDYNRDGVTDAIKVLNQGENVAGYRFSRYNYRVTFTGAIMENNSPIVNDSGNVPGAVAQWSNSWATYQTDNTNRTTQEIGVVYNFDPYVLQGEFLTGDTAPDAGFHLPQSSELIYQD